MNYVKKKISCEKRKSDANPGLPGKNILEVKRMTKQELIDKISEKCGCTKKDAAAAAAAFCDAVKEALIANDKVQLIGFGTFEIHERAARTGRNPQTGDEIKIAACKMPVFKVGKALKEAVNPAPKAKLEAKAKKKKK